MTAAVRRWLPPGTDGQLYALLDLADLVTGRLRWTTGLGTVECLGPLPADRSLVPSGLDAVVRTRGQDLERTSHLVRDARLAREIGRDDIDGVGLARGHACHGRTVGVGLREAQSEAGPTNAPAASKTPTLDSGRPPHSCLKRAPVAASERHARGPAGEAHMSDKIYPTSLG